MAGWKPALLEVAWGALEELPAAKGAGELAVARGDLAAHGHDTRAAFKRPAFERRVIDGHVLGLHGDFPAVIRIKDDEVGVGARLDCAFAREEVELLRDLRARGVDHRVQVDLSGLYAVGVEQIDPLFERRN